MNVDANIQFMDMKLKQIDDKGIFEADDDIGFFFDGVKKLQESLNKFKININQELQKQMPEKDPEKALTYKEYENIYSGRKKNDPVSSPEAQG